MAEYRKLSNLTHPTPILWRLLVPISLLIILIIASGSKIIFLQHKTRLKDQLDMMSDRIADAYHAEVSDLAVSLKFALIPIASNYHVKQLIESGDTESLYKTWQPIYESLKVEYGINHFTFMDKDRRRILRVHIPEQSGGTVNRLTILEAERTGKVAHGIELEMGSLEIPTLRVVQPVLKDSVIVGYVELGEDIDGLLKEINERTNSHLIATVFKEKIDYQRWAETMTILNREADWGNLNDAAIFYSTFEQIPTPLNDLLNSKELETISNGYRVSFYDKIWQVSEISIIDVAGNNIGSLIFMIDATSIVESFRKSIIIGGFIVSMLIVVLVGFMYFMLKRTDKLIILQHGAIVESKKNYKKLFNSVADSIVIYDLDGNFIDYNENACQLYGYPRSEIKDIKPQKIVHPDYHNILRENQQRLRAGETTLIESVHIRKDGTSFPVELKSLRIKIGDRPAIISVIRDVSDRKKQEEFIKKQSDWMDALLRTPTEGLWIVDSTKKFVLVNDAYTRMSGYTKNELLNMTIIQLEASENPDEVEMHIKNIIEKGWDIFESKHRRKDGSIYEVLVSVSFDSERNELYGYIRDITEDKKAKDLLVRVNTRFSIAESTGNLGVWEWNIKTNEVFWSDNLFKILGYNTNEVSPSKSLFEQHILPDDAEYVDKILERAALQSAEKYTLDFRIVKKNGETRWLSNKAIVLFDNNRNPEKMVGVCQDATEKVILQQELKIKENEIQNSITGVVLWGVDRLITSVNNTFKQLWGYESEHEVIGRSVFEFWQNPDDIVEIIEDMRSSISWIGERIAKRKDGSTFYCQISANFLSDANGNVTQFMGSFLDITEKIQIQERLKESEYRYHLLFKQSPYGVLLMDIDTGQTIESNETAAQQLGYTDDEFLSIKVSDYEAIETPAETFNRLKSIEMGRKQEFDTLHRSKTGKIRNVRVNAQPINLKNRNYVFAIFQDITERFESESLYNNILKAAIDGFFILNLKGQIVDVNFAYCDMVGYSRDELLKMNIFDIEALEDRGATKEHINKLIESGKDRFETRHKCKNGDEIIVEINVIFLDITGGMLVSFIKDITERKEKEKLVLNSLREKELLLREIHHRVKNNLQIVSSLLYLQSVQIEDKSIADIFNKNLRRIRAMALVHDYLYQSENLKSIDFKQYAMQLATNARDSFGNSTVLRINVETNQIIPFEQATYIGLLITELLNNSLKHAFKGRNQGEISIMLTKENASFLLTFADNGVGISNINEVLNGKSFGIKMIKTLAKQLDGTLEYRSHVGTQVTLVFPHNKLYGKYEQNQSPDS